MTVTYADSGLTAMTEDELLAVYRADETAIPAVLAECARRDRLDRLEKAREAARQIRAEWYDAAYAQYQAADIECRGELVNDAPGWPKARGDQPGRDDFALWTLPERDAMRFASEELREWWRVNPRLSFGAWRRQRAASEREARLEALAAGADAVISEAAEEFFAGEGFAEADAASGEITITATEEITDEQAAEFAEVVAGHLADAAMGGHEGAGLRLLGAADTVRPGGDGQQRAGAAAGQVRHAGPVQQRGGRRVVMPVSYDDEQMRPLERIDLWPGRIPFGDASLLYGSGAVGKGRMICDLIGRITTGRPMPLCDEDSAGDPGSVIVILPEDDPNEQVAHRLRAAGADLSRVYDLTRLDGGTRFKLSADGKNLGHLPHLRGLVDQLEAEGRNPRLVVIDPLAAVLGWGTIATNAGARRLVEPLQDMAKDTGVAVLVVAHTVKSGQLQGSAGLPQALRTVWKVSHSKDNPAFRELTLEKANNLPPTEPARYTVTEDEDGAIRVVWQDLAAVQEQRMIWRERLAERQARKTGAAPVSPQQAQAAGCKHSRSKFGTPAQCGDCPAARLRGSAGAPHSPAPPAPVPAAGPVTYRAIMTAQGQGTKILARGVTDLKFARLLCEETPEAKALFAQTGPLKWAERRAGVWMAGNEQNTVAWAVAVEQRAAQAV